METHGMGDHHAEHLSVAGGAVRQPYLSTAVQFGHDENHVKDQEQHRRYYRKEHNIENVHDAHHGFVFGNHFADQLVVVDVVSSVMGPRFVRIDREAEQRHADDDELRFTGAVHPRQTARLYGIPQNEVRP